MSTVALGNYDFAPKDARQNFPAPLLYIGWEDHLLFCSPVCLPLPGETPFGALASAVLPGVYGAHPDFARIDWSQVLWFKSGQVPARQRPGPQGRDSVSHPRPDRYWGLLQLVNP